MRVMHIVLVAPLVLVLAGSCESPNQPTPTCSYSVSPSSLTMGANGGPGTVGVTTTSECDWTATPNAAWLTLPSGASGTGSGSVAFAAAANPDTTPRSGTLTVAGHTVTVNQDAQAAACTYALSSNSASFNEIGGTGIVQVSAPSLCPWAATSSADWIQVTSGATGQGDGAVSFTVARNMDIPGRMGELLVAGQTLAVAQAGDIERCEYSVAPVQLDLCMPSRELTTTITTDAACPWTAAPAVPWIAVLDGSGQGTGPIRLRVDENYDAPRNGIVMVRWPAPTAGQNVQVEQAGCTYGVSQHAFSFGSGSASASFNVVQQSLPIVCGGPLQNACVWSAVSSVPWITIVTSMPRVGDDPVTFTIAPNPTSTPRTGQITVRDQVIVVTQAGS